MRTIEGQYRTLKEAQAALANLREAGAKPTITMGEWIDEWMESARHDGRRSPDTIDGYEWLAARYITPILGKVLLADIGAEHVRELHKRLRAWPVKDRRGKIIRRGVSDTQIGHVHSVLRQVLQQAQEERRIAWNPAAVVRPPQPDSTHHPQPTADDVPKLAAACTSVRDLARVLAAFHGLRPCEVLGLRWEDVHEDDEVPCLVVAHDAISRHGEGMVLRATKTARSQAPVPLTAACASALRMLRHESGGVGMVFPGVTPTSICRPEADRKRLYRLCDAAGVPRFRYGARGTVASVMVADRAAPRLIADTLRHAQVSTAQEWYAQTASAQVLAELEAVHAQLGLDKLTAPTE